MREKLKYLRQAEEKNFDFLFLSGHASHFMAVVIFQSCWCFHELFLTQRETTKTDCFVQMNLKY